MGYNFRNSVAYRGDDDPGDTVVDGGSGSQYSGPQGWDSASTRTLWVFTTT